MGGQDDDAPRAARHPFQIERHGDSRSDPYYWLNQRDNPEVIAYLEAENRYLATQAESWSSLQQELFEEAKARVVEDDESVPYLLNGYWYFTRYESDRQYPIYCRRAEAESAVEVMLDVNELAGDSEYFAVRGTTVSPDGRLLAFAVDDVGRRIYRLHFKDLHSGQILEESIEQVTGNCAWANDNQTLLYVRQDLQTLRSYQVLRHQLGAAVSEDALLYQEDDETFSCSLRKTRSQQYLLINCSQTLSDEVHWLSANDPQGQFQVFQPRRRELEYSVDHIGERFVIRTNHEAENFRLVETPVGHTEIEHWTELVPHQVDAYLQRFLVFDDFLVWQVREQGLTKLRIRDWHGEVSHDLEFDEPTYAAGLGNNPTTDTELLRFTYTSMTTPNSTFDYDMRERIKSLRKEQPIGGGFEKQDYRTERVWATARDGERVPISLVYHRQTPLDGTAPLMLYGYGSYGASSDARFSSERLNLIDRGFVYAIAHIRGGQELGRRWYEDGKMFNKINTFSDFIDSAEHLVEAGYVNRNRLYARGGSAGGLLIGAAINMRPDLFHAVVADVPFVDVVTTMLDDTIPLTTSEYDEWGNPNIREQYEYMLSYSPYDNVAAVEYPHMLVTTGLHDSQVQYWEPAKWVARLRERKTDDHLLLLKTNMSAGHGGASGRFSRLEEVALRHAFLIHLASLEE